MNKYNIRKKKEIIIKIKIWGARGGLPASGKTFLDAGGATSCIEIQHEDRSLIFDAGSGIANLGLNLIKNHNITKIDIFIGHYHYDHIIGLPFFLPLFDKKKEIVLHLPNLDGRKGIEVLKTLISPPLFPIDLEDMTNNFSINAFTPKDKIKINDIIFAESILLDHPGGNTGYKLSINNAKISYISDVENLNIINFNKMINFIRHSNICFIDSSYNPVEILNKRGWGHLSTEDIKIIAKTLSNTDLILYHHDTLKSDQNILNDSKNLLKDFKNIKIGNEGLEFYL